MKDRIGWVDPQAEMTEEEIEAVTHGRPIGFRRLRKTARREEQPAAPAGQERTGQEMGNGMNCNKLTRAQKEKAVQIAIGGGDSLDWLRTCGAKNPSAAWFYIKKTVAKADPKLYEKIPERPGMVINESGQAVPVKEQTLPEKFEGGLTAQVADEEAEWTAPPAAGDQTAAAGGDPSTPLRSAQDDKLVIKAEDIQAALDPAVVRMEAMAAEEPKLEDPRDRVNRIVDDLFRFPGSVSSVENPAGRVVVDKDGVHLEPPKEPKKPDWEKTTFFGIPCEVTGLKVDGFEFRRAGNCLMIDFPWMYVTVKLPVEQWKRVIDLVPKVMKIFGMDK